MTELTEELKNITEPVEFEQWLLNSLEDILFVKKILKTKIDKSNPENIKESATEAEGWYGRMTEMLADANKYLDMAENDNIVPKSKEVTDYDRTIKLAYSVAIQRSIRDKVEGLVNGIQQRISLCQSLISYEKQFVYGNKG
jgi:DNA polymerase III delta prime subunit